MFIWSDSREEESAATILNADKYDKNRRKAIKFKVERNLHINQKQINILDYYVTKNKGYIAWIKMDPLMIAEVHRRAARTASKDFRTTTFVPKLARDRKANIDKLLMEYKKSNDDFCYIVRNGERDLKVMIKRVSEGNALPYQNLHLDVLGRLSPLKTVTEDTKTVEETGENEDQDDGYRKQGRRNRNPSYRPKEEIFRNKTSILDGFSL